MSRAQDRPRRRRRFRVEMTLDRLEGRELMAFAGALDPTFGTGGVGLISSPPVANYNGSIPSASIALESDGSTLVAGLTGTVGALTVAVSHVDAGGAQDTSYGSGGTALVTLPSGDSATTLAGVLALPGGGAIVAVGAQPTSGSGAAATVVEQFTANGTPDATFGTGGQVVLSSSGGTFDGVTFTKDALEPDGKVLLAGTVTTNGVGSIVATRLDADGTVDATYGTDGLVTLSAFTTPPAGLIVTQTPSVVAIQPNSQFLVVDAITTASLLNPRLVNSSTAVFRLNEAGTQDTSLSVSGLHLTPSAISTAPDGEIVLAGTTTPTTPLSTTFTVSVAQLNAVGTVENSVVLPSYFNSGAAAGVALQADGDVLVTGDSETTQGGVASGAPFQVARLTPGLTLDATFGLGGVSTVNLPVAPPAHNITGLGVTLGDAVAITPAGQILVGGTVYGQSNFVARLDPTGTSAHPGDFTGDGIADPAVYLPAYGAFAIADSSGKTPGQVTPFGVPGPGNTIPAPGNYYATGQDDIAAYLPTLGLYAIKDPTGRTSGQLIAIGTPGPGQTLPAPGDYYGTGQDDVAVYLAAAGAFAIVDPTGQTPGMVIPFGIAGVGNAIPAPGDYFGTGHDDLALYLPTLGAFAIADPAGKVPAELIPFGGPGYGNAIPMPGDYDNSGRTELAVYLPALGEIVYRPADGGNDVDIPFGGPGAGTVLPAAADYTGSGRTDPAVYIPALGELAYRPPTGPDVYIKFGIPGPGQTIPVTVVAPPTVPDTIANPGSVSGLSVGGGYDPLDFVPVEASKKAKAGGSTS